MFVFSCGKLKVAHLLSTFKCGCRPLRAILKRLESWGIQAGTGRNTTNTSSGVKRKLLVRTCYQIHHGFDRYHAGDAALFSNHRGTSGPIQVIDAPRTATTIDRLFHETQDAMGLKRARDPYSGVITGGWSVPCMSHFLNT
jgi:hypothetical protein